MSEEHDLLQLIEILTTAIEIHGNEEEFFRRSSTASSNGPAKSLLLEIADELRRDRENLERRRGDLRSRLDRLEAVQKTR